MIDIKILIEDLSQQEINYLLQCISHEQGTFTDTAAAPVVSNSQVNYDAIRGQLNELCNLSDDYQTKIRQWLADFRNGNADKVVVADLGPNESAVIVTGMVALLVAIHLLTLKRITQEKGKTVEEFYSLPAELGKMLKSIPLGLMEAVQKMLGPNKPS